MDCYPVFESLVLLAIAIVIPVVVDSSPIGHPIEWRLVRTFQNAVDQISILLQQLEKGAHS